MTGFVFKVGECVLGVFDWFGELWRLSGWCEGRSRGLDVMESPTKKTKNNKPIKKI